MTNNYIFQSKRLGFRDWQEIDIADFDKVNANPKVMEFFPSTLTYEETGAFIKRLQNHFIKNGFTYFAVDRLDTKEFIGFIGMARQTYEADFTPCIDIGWRLAESAWGLGFATEGALRCLEYAFEELKFPEIVAVASVINVKSINVMKKIGMKEVARFKHSKLKGNERLEECVLYKIENK